MTSIFKSSNCSTIPYLSAHLLHAKTLTPKSIASLNKSCSSLLCNNNLLEGPQVIKLHSFHHLFVLDLITYINTILIAISSSPEVQSIVNLSITTLPPQINLYLLFYIQCFTIPLAQIYFYLLCPFPQDLLPKGL